MIDNSQRIPSSIRHAAHEYLSRSVLGVRSRSLPGVMKTDQLQLYGYWWITAAQGYHYHSPPSALQPPYSWTNSLYSHPAKGKTPRVEQTFVYRHSQSDVYPQGKLEWADSLFSSLNQEGDYLV